VVPLARMVVDREDDDFLRCPIDSVINQIGVFARDQLAHPFSGLRSADLRKQDQVLQRTKNGRLHLLG
jgi:hypothetical protein